MRSLGRRPINHISDSKYLISLRYSPGDRGNANQVFELSRTKGCCEASGGGHNGLSVRIGRESLAVLKELGLGPLISISSRKNRLMTISSSTKLIENGISLGPNHFPPKIEELHS